MADNSSPVEKSVGTGIFQSTLSPKYLHTNSTSHTWPFSAIAELVDNAYDPDVKASQLWIDKLYLRGKICLTFTDNGNGMTPEKLHKMLSFGFCEKVADGGHMPVGHYGNGFKSGSMRLGKDALVLTKQENSRSLGYLSQTYLELIGAETVLVPITTWDKTEQDKYFVQRDKLKAFGEILKYSLLRNEVEINEQFDFIPGTSGTRIIISNIRKTAENKSEFDFNTDERDIRIPDDANTDGGKYRQTKRQNHIPECDYSLKAYLAILYLKPKMQIILRGTKVKTLNVEKSLSKTEVDRYKPQGLSEPVKVVFGFNSRNKNHYGIMMYHRNRLIKPYERVGHQLKANNLGVGVVGVVQCDFLQPTHNKQDFDYTKMYRTCMNALGNKLNDYWNEKKGPARSSNNTQPLSEPQEIQSRPDQTWVQCDKPSCLKWRKLPDGIDPDSLPDKWYCHMNPDVSYKSCDVPEEKDDDTAPITPYAKVQKKRLEKELQEKNKRAREAQMAILKEQEQKERHLQEKEKELKKKEEALKKQYEALEETKPKVQVEGASKVPTAQVLPQPTKVTRPIIAGTPTSMQIPSRLSLSNQSTRNPMKHTPSPPLAASQSQSRASLSSSSTPGASPNKFLRNILTNLPTSAKTSGSSQYTSVRPKPADIKPPSIRLVAKAPPANLEAARLTFKVMKSSDGNTFLVHDKHNAKTSSSSSSSPSLGIKASATSTGQKIVIQTTSNATKNPPRNSNVDVKSRLPLVLPRSQSSTVNDRVCYISPTTQQQSNSSAQTTSKAITGSSLKDAITRANPSASIPASTFPQIVSAISTAVTPPEDKKPFKNGIKRAASESLVSPLPAKSPKKVDAVIVIDPLPKKESEPFDDKRIVMLETEWKDKMNKLQAQLNEKARLVNETTSQLDKMKTEMEQITKELAKKANQLDAKNEQLKCLRVNICKLLQVLVPEIDVASEEGAGEGETVDELLRQVLEANK